MTATIFRKQSRAPSLTELKIFPDQSHWTCLDAGWEEVADYTLGWVERNARPSDMTKSTAAAEGGVVTDTNQKEKEKT